MKLKRYMWTGALGAFYTDVTNQFKDDPYWTVRASATSNPSYANYGAVEFVNKKKPNRVFTFNVFISGNASVWRVGLGKDDGAGDGAFYPNAYVAKSGAGEIAFMANNNYNGTYNWTVFSSEDYIAFTGTSTNYVAYAAPVRILIGAMTPYETEDPAVQDTFWGILPMVPMSINDQAGSQYGTYNIGEGMVYRSRNNTPFAHYKFETTSVLPSPGINGKYYISPFYVYDSAEGVRGEFKDVYTAVLTNAALHPDETIIKIEGRQYYVFHVPTHANPNSYPYFYRSNGALYARPYFFDSNTIPTGQRVLLFDITEVEPLIELVPSTKNLTVELGKTANFTIAELTTNDYGTSERDVTVRAKYTSSNPNLITVSGGIVTGTYIGTATVTATLGKYLTTFTVTVVPPPPTIEVFVDKMSATIKRDETTSIKVTEKSTNYLGVITETDVSATATYTIADESVVAVDKGVITGLAIGATTITVEHAGQTFDVDIVIEKPDPIITISTDKETLNIIEGSSDTIVVTKHTDDDGVLSEEVITSLVTFTSSDDNIATVNDGIVTALTEGTVIVTVAYGELTKTVEVTVTKPEPTEPEPTDPGPGDSESPTDTEPTEPIEPTDPGEPETPVDPETPDESEPETTETETPTEPETPSELEPEIPTGPENPEEVEPETTPTDTESPETSESVPGEPSSETGGTN